MEASIKATFALRTACARRENESVHFSEPPDTNKLQITALGKENWSLISDEEKWQRTEENREKLGRGLSRFDRGIKPNP